MIVEKYCIYQDMGLHLGLDAVCSKSASGLSIKSFFHYPYMLTWRLFFFSLIINIKYANMVYICVCVHVLFMSTQCLQY